MQRLKEVIKSDKCPVCFEEIIIIIDSDDKGEWIHEVYRYCSCNIIINLNEIREKGD